MNAAKMFILITILVTLCMGTGIIIGRGSTKPTETITELAKRNESINTRIVDTIAASIRDATASAKLTTELERVNKLNQQLEANNKRLEDNNRKLTEGFNQFVGSINTAYEGSTGIADRAQRINIIAIEINKAVNRLLETITMLEGDSNSNNNISSY